VDPQSGAQTPVADSYACVNAVAVDAGGGLVFTGSPGCGPAAVFRIAADGTRTTGTSGVTLNYPTAIAIGSGGAGLVAGYVVVDDWLQVGFVRVDPQTGAQVVLSTNTIFNNPIGLAVAPPR